MQDDLKERLRALKWMLNCEVRGMIPDTTAYEAADRIAALEAKLAEKNALLRDCGEALGDATWDLPVESLARARALATLAKIKDATDA